MKNKFVENLIEKMTIEEKVGQLIQISGDYFNISGEITGPVETLNLNKDQIYECGSILGVVDAKSTKEIQKNYLENNRLGIPILFMADVVHGCDTIFPIPVALASSFNPKLAFQSARVAATEARVQGCHVTFAPMSDLAHDARWGRNLETNGEDPYLNKVFTKEYVKGFQGNSLSNDLSVASCVKHFAGYGMVEAGREYNTVDLSERFLREYHLPSYKAAIDANAKLVMTAFNTINSVPSLANKKLMRNILREEMEFDGVTISDWGAVKELINHQVALDKKEAAKKSIEAGLDIEMMTDCYSNELVRLVEDNTVNIELVDEAVKRVLKLKYELGLFEDPYKFIDENNMHKVELNEKNKELAKLLADESIVLLKNKNRTLPLSNEKVGLYGPMLESNDLMGAWSWSGRFEDVKSIKDVFEEKQQNYIFSKYLGTEFEIDDFTEVDKVIFFGGESSRKTGEAKSKTKIELCQTQVDIIRKLKQSGKEVIFVVFGGRPISITDIENDCSAIIYAWFPGTMGGYSVHDILYGDVNPSAKLAMSIPQNTGQCPISYREFQTGRPKSKAIDAYVSKYIDCSNKPLYSFGEGLNYSDIRINNIKYESKKIKENDKLIVNVEVENYSNISGKEVIQLYINDKVAEVIRPLKELKAFEKFELNANEKKKIILEVKSEDLKYINLNNNYQIDLGEIEVMIGFDSKNLSLDVIEII